MRQIWINKHFTGKRNPEQATVVYLITWDDVQPPGNSWVRTDTKSPDVEKLYTIAGIEYWGFM